MVNVRAEVIYIPLDSELKSALQVIFQGVVQSVKEEIQNVKMELQEQLHVVKSELRSEIQDVKRELQEEIEVVKVQVAILDEIAYFKQEISLIHRNLTTLNCSSSDQKRALSDLEINISQLQFDTRDQLYHSHQSMMQLLNGIEMIQEQTVANTEEIVEMRELV